MYDEIDKVLVETEDTELIGDELRERINERAMQHYNSTTVSILDRKKVGTIIMLLLFSLLLLLLLLFYYCSLYC